MRDVLLFIILVTYMIGSFFIIDKLFDLVGRNFKEYDYELEEKEKLKK